MPRYGFIHEKAEIKYLVLFAMDLIPFPVSYDAIVDIVTWCDEGFGFFELSEAFYELVPTGHITEDKTSGQTPLYSITDKGREAAKIFEKQLPFPVREAAQRSSIRVVRQIRRDAAVHTSVTENGENDLKVRMELDEVFAVELNVINRQQASMLQSAFRKKAEQLYQTLLLALTTESGDK